MQHAQLSIFLLNSTERSLFCLFVFKSRFFVVDFFGRRLLTSDDQMHTCRMDLKFSTQHSVMATSQSESASEPGAMKWRPSDVASFIRSLNPPYFDSYAAEFERAGVDGPILIHDVSDEWLTTHISSELHRARIKRELTALRRTCGVGEPGLTEDVKAVTAVLKALPTGSTIHTAAIGGSVSTHHYHGITAADLKAEPYDFSSIIANKLSDIKLESFGREWLYIRMYEWIIAQGSISPVRAAHTPQRAAKSQVMLVTGEPVCCFVYCIA